MFRETALHEDAPSPSFLCSQQREQTRAGCIAPKKKLEAVQQHSPKKKLFRAPIFRFSGANQRQHMQIADPAGHIGFSIRWKCGIDGDQASLIVSLSRCDLALCWAPGAQDHWSELWSTFFAC